MNLSQLFQRSVQLHADRPALGHGNQASISYAQLDERVRALAGWLLREQGLQPGDRITLAMKNCTQYMELLLASWHAGLCAVPVNIKLHPNEIAYMVRDSGSRACVVQTALLEPMRDAVSDVADIRLIDIESPDFAAAYAAQGVEPAAVDEQELAWLFYTSGTTGRPKGVVLSHANMVSMAMHFYVDIQSVENTDVLVHAAPMSHGSGLYGVPYFVRGALQLVPPSGGFEEDEIFDIFNTRERVSMFAAPTMVHRLVEHALEHGVQAPGLRNLFVGGAPFYVEDIKRAIACFGPRITQMYGQGETPMTISALPAEALARAVAEDDTTMLASVGFAQTAMQVDIFDGDNRPVVVGELGEVVVKGPTVMRGYWNNPKATEDTVINGWLRTGDVGLMDARGLLYLKDRSKDVIISGGTNIYPREVEEALLTHADVDEVSVVGAPDPEWGESVVAFVVRRPQAQVNEQDLDTLCIDTIARFKRPKRYIFVEELPKNGTGKVLKRELQARLGNAG